jgi:hypothetical protein
VCIDDEAIDHEEVEGQPSDAPARGTALTKESNRTRKAALLAAPAVIDDRAATGARACDRRCGQPNVLISCTIARDPTSAPTTAISACGGT